LLSYKLHALKLPETNTDTLTQFRVITAHICPVDKIYQDD